MYTARCLSCREPADFGSDGFPVEGKVITNQVHGICTKCVREIMSDSFWSH